MIYDIPVDFSGMSTLHCARRFDFTVRRGLVTTSGGMAFGSAVHQFAEARNKLDKTPLLTLAVSLGAKWSITDANFVLACAAFDSKYQPKELQLDTLGHPLVEYKYSIPVAVINNKWRIVLTGTIDLIQLLDGYINLVDYKTMAAVGNAAEKQRAKYTSSFQLVFYMYVIHKYLHAFLPPPYNDLARALAISANYSFIYKSLNPVKIENSAPRGIGAADIAIIEGLLSAAINKIVAIYEAPADTLHPPEGMLHFACPECPYHHICITNDTSRINETLATMPSRQYDPTNFR